MRKCSYTNLKVSAAVFKDCLGYRCESEMPLCKCRAELGTLELWISRSMLDPLFFNLETNLILYLYPEKCIKFNQSESRIGSREILNFARHLRLIYKNGRVFLILKNRFLIFLYFTQEIVD